MDLSTIKASVDALTEKTTAAVSKVETDLKATNDNVERLQAQARRPGVAANDNGTPIAAGVDPTALRAEHKAVAAFIRSGDESGLTAIKAANSVGSDPDGGYLVLPQHSTGMTRKLWDSVTMRRLARVETMESGDTWLEPVDFDEVGATWVGEQTSRPETDSAEVKMLRVSLNEIYALTAVTQRLLDDSSFPVAAWIDGKQIDKFGRSEDVAFVNGNGVSKPRGFLTYDTSTAADSARAWGTLQKVATGAAATVTADGLKNLMYALRAPYRAGASWLLNSNTANALDKLKNGNGDYVWRDSMTAGAAPSLLGYPVEFDETMPDLEASSLSIAFGNWRLAYVIVDRPGVRFLRDPFSSKPHVLFYSYKRTGGGLANSEALKLAVTQV